MVSDRVQWQQPSATWLSRVRVNVSMASMLMSRRLLFGHSLLAPCCVGLFCAWRFWRHAQNCRSTISWDKTFCRTNYVTHDLGWVAATKVPVWEQTQRGTKWVGVAKTLQEVPRWERPVVVTKQGELSLLCCPVMGLASYYRGIYWYIQWGASVFLQHSVFTCQQKHLRYRGHDQLTICMWLHWKSCHVF